MTNDKTITANIIRQALDYDSTTGIFVWKNRPVDHFTNDVSAKKSNTRWAGKQAGSINKVHGYIGIFLFGRRMQAHRLAWIISNGDISLGEIDHINGIRSDNRIENLRLVTRSENHKNTKRPKHNSSGFIGVSWHIGCNKWQAYIKINGKVRYLGMFDHLDDAVNARHLAEKTLCFHKNHGRS
jgi:hypothetical protein